MTSAFLAPDPIQGTKFIPGGNTPAAGGKLFCYAAGSTTKQAMYTTNAGSVQWSNPIVLDSGGNLGSSNEVWIPAGAPAKFVLAPSNDTDPPTSPYWEMDNISGINDTTGGVPGSSADEWVAGPTPTFVSSTQFTLGGDQTALFTVGRRVRATVTAGTVYGTITASVFGALTTVTIQGAVLDSGLSAIFYGLLDPANTSIDFYHISRQASAVLVASATTNIWATDGNSVHLSSTVTIGSFSTAPYVGALKTVIADNAFTLQNSSTKLVLPGGFNRTVVPGDIFDVYADTASKMSIINYSSKLGDVFVIDSATAPISISNSSTDASYTKSIAGGAFSSTRSMDINMIGSFVNNTATTASMRIRGSYGGTALFDTTAQAFGNGGAHAFALRATVSAANATNVQNVHAALAVASTGTAAGVMTGTSDFVASAINQVAVDSTIAQNLVLTATLSVANTSLTFTAQHVRTVLY